MQEAQGIPLVVLKKMPEPNEIKETNRYIVFATNVRGKPIITLGASCFALS